MTRRAYMRFISIFIMFAVFYGSVPVFAADLYPAPLFRWTEDGGDPATDRKVKTFEPGTSTLKSTYTDRTQETANDNPVILDFRGEAAIYFSGVYDIEVLNSADVTQKTIANFGNASTIATINGGNLVSNGSFETDTDGNGTPDNWVLTTYSGSTVEIVTDVQYHGTDAYKFTSGGLGGGYIVTDAYVAVSQGRTYTASFMMKSSVVDVRNLIEVIWYTSAFAEISTTTVFDDDTANPTSWTLKELEVTPPATAMYAKLRMYGCHSSDITAGSTWFDDARLSVKEWTDTTLNVGRGGYSSLVIVYVSASTFDVDADSITLANATGTYDALSVNLTCDMATDLDTGASETADTWYSVWVSSDGTTESCIIDDGTATPADAGTYYRRVGWVRNDGASDLWNTRQTGDWVSILDDTSGAEFEILNAGTSDSYVAPTLVVPSTATAIVLYIPVSGIAADLSIDGTNLYAVLGSNGWTPILMPLNASQQFYYKRNSASSSVSFDLLGWKDNL